ncbi:MAG: membrane dipeptidase [Cyclobacteriaceae bacterium]|nr:membrane dipeptidase [Cyclobacteriaceae bacterium]
MHRRTFLKKSAVAATALAMPLHAIAQPARPALVFDAMGEIRTLYTPELIREILASGTRAITITLSDPKVIGHAGYELTLEEIRTYEAYFGQHPDLFIKATRLADIDRARRENKLAVFYLIQNASPIDQDWTRMDHLYDQGLRSIQLTYNHRNLVGDGCKERTDAGLSIFGLELIDRMNARNMLIDLSHAGMTTMKEAITASKKPVIISHTCCKALYDNVRNTTDENLKLLADRGGVVGICQIRVFMTTEKKNNLEVYFQHIDHAVKVAGTEHVAIGSDRDHRVIPDTEEEIKQLLKEEGANFIPDEWPLYLEKLNGPRRMEVIWDGLLKRGYKPSDAEKIMGTNLYRIYRETIG